MKRNDVLGELTLADGTRFVLRVAAAATTSRRSAASPARCSPSRSKASTLAPVGAVTHLCDKIPNASVTRWRYTRALSGTINLGHFAWTRHSPGLAEHVTEWMREHTA